MKAELSRPLSSDNATVEDHQPRDALQTTNVAAPSAQALERYLTILVDATSILHLVVFSPDPDAEVPR